MLGYIIIEPVAKNKLPHNYGPKVYKPREYNCQMNELMFQALGVKGMSERSELTPCIILIREVTGSRAKTFSFSGSLDLDVT